MGPEWPWRAFGGHGCAFAVGLGRPEQTPPPKCVRQVVLWELDFFFC